MSSLRVPCGHSRMETQHLGSHPFVIPLTFGLLWTLQILDRFLWLLLTKGEDCVLFSLCFIGSKRSRNTHMEGAFPIVNATRRRLARERWGEGFTDAKWSGSICKDVRKRKEMKGHVRTWRDMNGNVRKWKRNERKWKEIKTNERTWKEM